ncbi:MAG TPA: hypothetical protein VLH83_00020 [Chthoniobacterales bacterium]|nr:hypothetical protein [Chthoniobacterales bacterium]
MLWDSDPMDDQLPAVIAKIERMLAKKPEYLVAQPSELRAVAALSNERLQEIARQNGWRVVRRVGGRQIEFYDDAAVNFRPL